MVLEAVFARGSEDGRDTQSQAQQGDGAEAIRLVMRAVEAEVVVELGELGQAVGTPVGDETLAGELGSNGGGQEGADQPAVQGDSVEDLDFAHVLDDEALNDVEGIQLGAGLGDGRQVPTWRRRGATDATGVVNQPVALEDIRDGGAAWEGWFGGRVDPQSAEDGHRAELPQGVAPTEAVTQGNDELDHLAGESPRTVPGTGGLVVKADAMQPLSRSTLHPVLHVGEGQTEPASDLPQGQATSSQGNDFAPLIRGEFFMRGSLRTAGCAASFVPAPLRSASTALAAQPAPHLARTT